MIVVTRLVARVAFMYVCSIFYMKLCDSTFCLDSSSGNIVPCELNQTRGAHCFEHCQYSNTNSTHISLLCSNLCYHPIDHFTIRCENKTVVNERGGYCTHCCDTSWCTNTSCFDELRNTTTPSNAVTTVAPNSRNDHTFIILAVCLTVLGLAVSLVVVAISCLYCNRKRRSVDLIDACTGKALAKEAGATAIPGNGIPMHDCDTMTSGSGSGKPFMILRTIAREIKLGDVIGSGRYGQVYVGEYHDELVAVKIFSTLDEESWQREKDTIDVLRHDNILSYIGADMISNNGVTELWLITKFHPHGSLYDFLSGEDVRLSPSGMIQLVLSICNGLLYLHTPIFGVGAQMKPAMTHRDLKSKNILVKTNGTCCIADFGLAILMDSSTRKLNMPATFKHGTIRYMAPEILNNTIDISLFESFVSVDIYALGLVIWEVGLRTGDGEYDEYQVPFYNMVPHEPSIEDMRKIVGVDEQRPPIPNRWKKLNTLREMKELMCECWYQDAAARLSAARVKRRLMKIAQEEKVVI